MHLTIVKDKKGNEFSGWLKTFQPCFNYFCIQDSNDIKYTFCFDDVESVVTKGQRVSIYSPLEGEDQDEIERARKDLRNGREHGWTEENDEGVLMPYPEEKWDWE